jgi:hypothetical protein
MADEEHHLDKTTFKVPFVCGCRNLGEALRRISGRDRYPTSCVNMHELIPSFEYCLYFEPTSS